MKNKLLFISLISSYAVSVYFKYYIPSNNWFNQYWADLVCMPIVFAIALKCIQIVKKNNTLTLSVLQVTIGAVYYALLFEFLAPQFDEKYTADFNDVICYFIGALGYWIWQKKMMTNAHSEVLDS